MSVHNLPKKTANEKAAADLEDTLNRLHQVAAMAHVLEAAFSDQVIADDPKDASALQTYAETMRELLDPTYGAVQAAIEALSGGEPA